MKLLFKTYIWISRKTILKNFTEYILTLSRELPSLRKVSRIWRTDISPIHVDYVLLNSHILYNMILIVKVKQQHQHQHQHLCQLNKVKSFNQQIFLQNIIVKILIHN